MINILSYVGMNMQSEVCLWCLLGLMRTIFDATLFKVNANLKQVWQMTMPEELTMPVQRVLRTMVSGVMLVQCFTVYVYLASYIVLLYPVFLEERPTLVLPWLLLAAVRKLLCELMSLALGLGTCVLLGPARPHCIKFVIVKFTKIIPAFYMWMLVFSYYHALKVASAFKTFPAVLPPNDNDCGLELAVRRRRTKSLLGEEQLRKKLVAHFYGERTPSITNERYLCTSLEISSRMVHSIDISIEDNIPGTDVMKPSTISTTGWSDIGAYEDWFGSEVMIPRDTDRILEQIVLMLLRIGAYLKKGGIESILDSQILNSAVPASWLQRDSIHCAAMNADETDTPPLVGSSKGNMASYLREYPQIFMKKQSPDIAQTELTIQSLKTVQSCIESDESNTIISRIKNATPNGSMETIFNEVEKVASKQKIMVLNKTTQEDTSDKLTTSQQLKTKQTAKVEGKKIKLKRKKLLDLESQPGGYVNEITKKVKNDEESKILTEEDDKEFLDNKISNEDTNTDSTVSKISHEDKSKISTEENNKDVLNNKISNEYNNADSTVSKISIGDNNTDSTASKISNEDNSKITTEENNKEFLDNKISNVDNNTDSIVSKISNENNTKELTHSKILNDVVNRKSTHSKKSHDSNDENITDRNISKEDKNNDLSYSASNESSKEVLTVNKI